MVLPGDSCEAIVSNSARDIRDGTEAKSGPFKASISVVNPFQTSWVMATPDATRRLFDRCGCCVGLSVKVSSSLSNASCDQPGHAVAEPVVEDPCLRLEEADRTAQVSAGVVASFKFWMEVEMDLPSNMRAPL
eukprot:scaffold2208_cov237-Pinguiococcus_pyrenoidosus.AAC.4